MNLRCAVVGSGAAAMSVVQAVLEQDAAAEIVVFDGGADLAPPLEHSEPAEQWSAAYFDALYTALRADAGLKFPPPKTHFGAMPARLPVQGWGDIWQGNALGGLTGYWGGSVLPYPARELQGWPLERGELEPHYHAVADRVGIAGRRDRLNEWLGEDFINRPPVEALPIMGRLEAAINGRPVSAGGKLLAGSSRLAVDTRIGTSAQACSRCGQCMLGCPRHSIYAAGRELAYHLGAGRVTLVRSHVTAIRPDTATVVLADGTAREFDRLYLAAGCVNSTRLAITALGIDHLGEGAGDGSMVDNAVCTFPILYLGSTPGWRSDDAYFSLTNLLALYAPANPVAGLAAVQVYPFFDHLWRYFIPPRMWPRLQPIAARLRGRLLLGRLYASDEYSQRYAFDRDNAGDVVVRLAAKPNWAAITRQWQDIRTLMNGNGFYVPPLPLIRHRTSSHYAGPLAIGRGVTGKSGRIGRRSYICDGAALPSGSALSPTLTIMAMAHRNATLSLQ